MRAAALVVVFFVSWPAWAAGESPHRLLLELWVNGRSTHKVVQVDIDGSDILLRPDDVRKAGIRIGPADGPDGLVRIGAVSGLAAEIDLANQRLLLTAAPERLAPQVFNLRPSEFDGETAQSATGAMFDYDISASALDVSRSSHSVSLAGQMGLSIFMPGALLTIDGFAGAVAGGGNGARLDTALEFDDAAQLRRVVLGDSISGGLDWSRAVRFGGIQLASDFSLRPDLVTMPLPQFFGTAAVPTTVDVFSGAVRLFETDVDPGPFELNDIPVVTGGGSATVVLRDILGRQTVQTIPFYATGRLLARGLSAYDIDAGFLRRDYGAKSFSYDMPMFALTVRHGMTDAVTAEAHGEATPEGALAGAGLAFGLGDVGALSADIAASRSAPGTGLLASLGLEGWVAPLKIFGSVSAATKWFSDVAAMNGDPVPTLRFELGAALSFGRFGALAANWTGGKTPGQPATDLVSASYSLSGGNSLFFGLTGLRDLGAHVWAAQAFVSVPLGSGSASFDGASSGRRASAQAMYTVPVDPDGGVGWQVMAQDGDAGPRLQGEATVVGGTGRYDGALAAGADGVAARAGVSGSLVCLAGDVFAARKTDGAVALVKTGAEGVRIYRENRPVAVSDAGGEALLTGLVPYAPNHVGIDPRDYPIATIVARSDVTIAPQRRSGVVIDLSPDRCCAFMARFVVSDGSLPPVGARVDVEALSVPLMVGRGGKVFVAGLNRRSAGFIDLGERRCRFALAPQDSAKTLPQTENVECKLD